MTTFEIAGVLALSAFIIFLVYMSVNSKLERHLRTLLVFMSFFGLLMLVQMAVLITQTATTNTNIITLLDTVYSVLLWFFLFIGSVFAILQFTTYFKNGKISAQDNTDRTR